LSRVASAHDGGFLALVLPEEQPESALPIEIRAVIAVVGPVDCVAVRSSEHAKYRKISKPLRVRIHDYAGRSSRDVSQIVTVTDETPIIQAPGGGGSAD
jgi:hypothetical protein